MNSKSFFLFLLLLGNLTLFDFTLFGLGENSAFAVKRNIHDKVKNLELQIASLRSTVNKLSEEIAKLENAISDNVTNINKHYKRMNNKQQYDKNILDRIDEQLDANLRSDSIQRDGIMVDSSIDLASTMKAYKNARYKMTKAYTEGTDLDDARKELRNFIKSYPSSRLVGNAYYWLAETYMHDKNHGAAAIEYLHCYQVTNNERTLDSLLGLGKSLLNMGKRSQVCAVVVQIHKMFPELDSRTHRKIKELAERSGCN